MGENLLKACNSCNKAVSGDFVEFKCPGCGKETIRRCRSCRESSMQYTCSSCGFVGP